MMGIKRIEKIRNEEIRARAGVANTSETIREEMVRPCGEKDRRRCSNENMEVGGHRKIGRPKLRWSDVTGKDTKENGVQRKAAQDRRTWRMETGPQIGKGQTEEDRQLTIYRRTSGDPLGEGRQLRERPR